MTYLDDAWIVTFKSPAAPWMAIGKRYANSEHAGRSNNGACAQGVLSRLHRAKLNASHFTFRNQDFPSLHDDGVLVVLHTATHSRYS